VSEEVSLTTQVMGRRVRIAVLIGKGGRLPAIWDATQHPTSLAKVAVVVSFKSKSPGIEWAKRHHLPAFSLRWSEYKDEGKERAEYDQDLAKLLIEHRVELVVIAGWGLLLSPEFLEEFPKRVINVHPALLTESLEPTVHTHSGTVIPVFRGNQAIEMALATGVDTTGCTVHYVTDEMDTGLIILKREVSLRHGDDLETLTERIHEAEDEILPQAIELICEDYLRQVGAFE